MLYDTPSPDSMTLSLDCEEDEHLFSDCAISTAVREQGCSDTTALRCLRKLIVSYSTRLQMLL